MGGGNSKTQQETKNENHDPWVGQQPYLKEAFAEAQGIYNNQKGQPGYKGDFVATGTPAMYDAFNGAMGWAGNQGQTAANTAVGTGVTNAQQGTEALGQVQQGLTDFRNKDWTQTHIDNAGRYADNPFMQAMVDSATADAKRTFSEETMRGIDQNAAAGGNTLSTRAGVAAGIAQRGLADTVANTSAGLRGAAWDNGLKMSQGDQASILSALMGQGGLAADQIKTGLAGLETGSTIGQRNLDQQVLASTMLTGLDQGKLDNEIAKHEYASAQPWEQLGNYWSVVGDKSWGGTVTGSSTTKVKDNPSTLSTLGAGVGILGSLFRSDVRTKKNLTKVGETPEGITVYRYQYRDDPSGTFFEAPLAQDVQKLFPDAVVEVNGTLFIDTSVYDWR